MSIEVIVFITLAIGIYLICFLRKHSWPNILHRVIEEAEETHAAVRAEEKLKFLQEKLDQLEKRASKPVNIHSDEPIDVRIGEDGDIYITHRRDNNNPS